MSKKILRNVLVMCLLTLALSVAFAIALSDYMIHDYIQNHQPVVIIPTGSTLETPTPNTYPTSPTNTPTVTQPGVTGIGFAWSYVLHYDGQGKGQTPVFFAANKWVLHWQCYLPGGKGKFPINVYEANGKSEQPANIWDCKPGHTSGNSPVYCSGQFFVAVDPGQKNAKYDLLIEVYK